MPHPGIRIMSGERDQFGPRCGKRGRYETLLDDLTCATPTHFIPIRLEQVAEAINGPMSAQRADPPLCSAAAPRRNRHNFRELL